MSCLVEGLALHGGGVAEIVSPIITEWTMQLNKLPRGTYELCFCPFSRRERRRQRNREFTNTAGWCFVNAFGCPPLRPVSHPPLFGPDALSQLPKHAHELRPCPPAKTGFSGPRPEIGKKIRVWDPATSGT